MTSYQGRKAVVIGGTHGIGLATVDMLLQGGAEVLLTGRNPENIAAVAASGRQVHAVAADASRVEDAAALAATVRRTLGVVDFVHVNVGIAELLPIAEVTADHFDRLFGVNVRGAFFTLQALLPLVRDGGAVVFTSSVADEGGTPGMAIYSATKAALVSLASSLAAELLPRSIRVNTVVPGFIHTPTGGVVDLDAGSRAQFEALGDATTPMRRHGSAEEVARAVLFLGFEATFTTGARLAVDGGLGQKISAPQA